MGLKIDDLDIAQKSSDSKIHINSSNQNTEAKQNERRNAKANDTESSIYNISIDSKNLIHQSIKNAILYMIENKETADDYTMNSPQSCSYPEDNEDIEVNLTD